MLRTTKSIALTGSSEINSKQAIYLNANITEETAGSTNINQSIVDQELYKANRVECRNDITAFQEKVWDIEDSLLEEAAANTVE